MSEDLVNGQLPWKTELSAISSSGDKILKLLPNEGMRLGFNSNLSSQVIRWNARLINIFEKSLKIIQNMLDDRNYLNSHLFMIEIRLVSLYTGTVILKIISM